MDQQNGANWTEERVIGILRELANDNELPQHLAKGTIKGTDTVEYLGIDSIGAVVLLDRLEEEAGVQLADDFLGFGDSVGKIVMLMNSLKSNGEMNG